MVTADSLRDFGFEVVEAATAAAAIARARQDIKSFKAAIVDLGLPDQKGDLLAAELRRLRGDLPIVIATGQGENGLPATLKDAGMITVLGKPYDSKGLQSALALVGVVSVNV